MKILSIHDLASNQEEGRKRTYCCANKAMKQVAEQCCGLAGSALNICRF